MVAKRECKSAVKASAERCCRTEVEAGMAVSADGLEPNNRKTAIGCLRGNVTFVQHFEPRNTSAGIADGNAPPQVVGKLTTEAFPRVRAIFADNKYHNHKFYEFLLTERQGKWRLEISS